MFKNEMIKLLHTKSVYAAILIGIFSCICGLYSYYDTAYWAYTVGFLKKYLRITHGWTASQLEHPFIGDCSRC